jgi:cytochrome P450
MGPAVWGQPRIATEDTLLGNYFIPKNTIVTVDIVGLQHDENIWKDPYKFNPERFNSENESNITRSGAWIPFGSGQR